LAGHPPFQSSAGLDVLVKLLQEDPQPLRKLDPSIPEELETIVMKCLEKDPAQRYDSARSLAEDLQRFLDGDSIKARPTSWTYRIKKRARQNRPLVVSFAMFLIAVSILSAIAVRARWN